jgi:hypothetical protein
MKTSLPISICSLFFVLFTAHGQLINQNNLPGNTTVGPLGSGAVGQPLFDAPSGTTLTDFTYFMLNSGGTDENVRFSLMTWNGGIDSVVWTGPVVNVSATDTALTPFTVDPNFTLAPGNTYNMVVSELGLNGGNDGSVSISISPPGPNPGQYGLFVDTSATDPSDRLDEANWGAFIGAGLTYNADFSTNVPDAGSSLFLLSLGLAGIAILRRTFVKA